MENRRVLKKEGLNLTIDKEVLDDQRVLEVSTEVPDKAKVEKEDKDDFENYKVLYKGAIDDRCLEEYGTCDDEKLWEDTAKEMFLKAVNYIPEEDKKADGELVDREKEQEPTLVRENRSVIKHNKVVENKEIKTETKINFSEDGNIAKQQVYTLQDILDAANTIDDMWNSLGNELTDQIDGEFNDNPSHCIRWLISNIEDVLENDAKGIIKENKESSIKKFKVETPFGNIDVEAKDENEALEKVKAAFRDNYKDKVKVIENKECSMQD